MSDANVIDAQAWLIRHVDRLLESDGDAAIDYLERLLVSSEDPGLRVYCLKNLGLVHLSHGELEEAEKYLRHATELSPSDPILHHALGEIAASAGHLWLALIEFTEAMYHSRDRADVVAFMRSVATTMRQLELGEVALAVLLGAHERDPEDPFVLDSLARMYESQARFLEAIEARDSLVQVLETQNALPPGSATPIETERAREQLNQLSRRLRGDLRIVGTDHEKRARSELSRLNSPSGLHTLIAALGLREHNEPLLETAEVLWARASYLKFDVHLSIPTLAAGIHWIVERMHWRVPTTLHELAPLYGADEERLPAAVRLLVACLEVELIPTPGAPAGLSPSDRDRFEKLQKAILYDVDIDHVEPRAMLGGDDDG